MIDIMKYKNEITNWAGFIGAVLGGVAIYFKDIFPEAAGICGALALLCGTIIAWFTGKQAAVKVIAVLLIPVLLMGCACMNYQSPDGTKVSYCRFCTGSDSIKGEAGKAKIETTGQKQLDPAVIQLLLEAAKAVK